MLVDIRTTWRAGGILLWLGAAASQKEAVEKAVREHACLRHANLYGFDLQGAVLDNADLSFACLRFANLSGASLRNAVLAGADTHGVN